MGNFDYKAWHDEFHAIGNVNNQCQYCVKRNLENNNG